jgi:hypothetical protein
MHACMATLFWGELGRAISQNPIMTKSHENFAGTWRRKCNVRCRRGIQEGHTEEAPLNQGGQGDTVAVGRRQRCKKQHVACRSVSLTYDHIWNGIVVGLGIVWNGVLCTCKVGARMTARVCLGHANDYGAVRRSM